LASVVLLIGSLLVPSRVEASQPRFPVAAILDLGRLHLPQGPIGDLGGSVDVGGREVWVFGDTFLSRPNNAGQTLITNVGASSTPASPFALTEQLEQPSGDPVQMIPFTPAELAFNIAAKSPSNRIALWPLSTVLGGNGNGYVLIQDVHVEGPWDFIPRGVGLAVVRPGSLVARRIGDRLFSKTEPGFFRGAYTHGKYVYTQACDHPASYLCDLARAPLAQLTDRSAYTFWNGQAWNADVTTALPVVPGNGSGLSVEWNSHLNAYLAVFDLGTTNKIMASTAPSPQGPWSPSSLVFKGLPTPTGSFDYGVAQHPSLASPDGRQLIVTYTHPLTAPSTEVRVVHVDLP
jgi:hypothetical protein